MDYFPKEGNRGSELFQFLISELDPYWKNSPREFWLNTGFERRVRGKVSDSLSE